MERLIFTNDLDSIHRLDQIMYSYQGRSQGSVLEDERTLNILLFLLEHGEIVITEYIYPHDYSIHENAEMMEVYCALVPQTRWKQFEHTEIEGVRINALKQMLEMGVPSYDDYICYQEGQINVHCGNIAPRELLTHLARHQELRQFYIFAYPYWSEDKTAKYYCFEFSDNARRVAIKYQEIILDMMYTILSKRDSPIPDVPPTWTDSTE